MRRSLVVKGIYIMISKNKHNILGKSLKNKIKN